MAGNDDKLFTWIWRILSGPLAIMAMGAIVEGLVSGTVDNLMARGEPSPEEFAYERQPVAYISMLGMWLLLLLVSAWLFWRVWLSREGAR